jgi:RNA polymerase primary sigma factor
LRDWSSSRGSRATSFVQLNSFLPQDVKSPTELRSVLKSLQELNIEVLADVPGEGTEGEIEAEDQEGPDATTELAPTADAIGDSSDPVRLYLTEIGNFQLLSRAQEVEIAKRIQAGENEVQEEVMRSAVTLDLVIEIGVQVETGEADVGYLFEESEEPADADEQGGREARAKQLKQLSTAITKLKSLRGRIRELDQRLKGRPGASLKAKLEKHGRALQRAQRVNCTASTFRAICRKA